MKRRRGKKTETFEIIFVRKRFERNCLLGYDVCSTRAHRIVYGDIDFPGETKRHIEKRSSDAEKSFFGNRGKKN